MIFIDMTGLYGGLESRCEEFNGKLTLQHCHCHHALQIYLSTGGSWLKKNDMKSGKQKPPEQCAKRKEELAKIMPLIEEAKKKRTLFYWFCKFIEQDNTNTNIAKCTPYLSVNLENCENPCRGGRKEHCFRPQRRKTTNLY